jgi:5'-deoxynucleotidase YfbR-like HD superfamily hydrolase
VIERKVINKTNVSSFESNNTDFTQEYDEPIRTPASIALELGSLSMRFARVERVPRYDDGRRESDAEHSFMLGMVATEIAYQYYPHADTQLIGEYSRVHDLVELSVGDVATFNLTDEQLNAKELAEHEALDELLESLPPYTAALLRRYEKQEDIEAKIVRAVDKMLAVVVDVIGQGTRIMKEDYDVHSKEDLQASHRQLGDRMQARFGELPELVRAHNQLCEVFETVFDASEA